MTYLLINHKPKALSTLDKVDFKSEVKVYFLNRENISKEFMVGWQNYNCYRKIWICGRDVRFVVSIAMCVGVDFFNLNAPEGRKAGGLKN